MTERHQRQRREQLERRALLAEQRGAAQSGAERRMPGLFALLRLQTLFLPLGAPVLKPDLYLSLGEPQGRGDGVPLQHRKVVASLETVLQQLQLLQGERGADPTALLLRALEPRRARDLVRRAPTSTCRGMLQLSGFISGNMTS